MPDSNTGAIHPLWKKIPPYAFFNLGNRLTLNIGVELYVTEVVTQISMEGKSGLISAVVDSLSGKQNVRLIPNGNEVVGRCGCADFKANGFCHHIASAAALTFHLLHGSTFGYKKPSESYVEARRREFRESAALAAANDLEAEMHDPAYATSFLILVAGEDGLEAEFFHHPKVKTRELTHLLHDFPSLEYPGNAYWLQRSLHSILSRAFELELPVKFAIEDTLLDIRPGFSKAALRFFIDPEPEPEAGEPASTYEANGPTFDLEIKAVDPKTKQEIPLSLVLFNAFIIFARDGGVFLFDPKDSAPWSRLVEGRLIRHPEKPVWLIRSIEDGAFDLPNRDELNSYLLGCALTEKEWKREKLWLRDEKGEREIWKLPQAGVLRPVFSLERMPYADGEAVHVQILLGNNNDLINPTSLAEQLKLTIALAQDDERFFTAKGRTAAFRAILLRMLTAEDLNVAKMEALAAIKDDPALSKKPLWGTVMVSFIQAVADAWATGTRWTPLFDGGDRAPSALWEVDRRQFLVACLALHDETTRFDNRPLDVKVFSGKRALFDALDQISLAAAISGASILLDGKPIIRDRVEVALHALAGEEIEGEADKIDWFELRPEVRCGEFTIRPEDWERMLSGQLLLQKDDGSVVLPELDEAVLRQYLEDLDKQRRGSGKKKGTAGLRINRLEMLSALELRRHGAKVELPPEVEATYEALQNFEKLPVVEPPASVTADLRAYQKQAVGWLAFLYQHRFGACLADDMGLGKTIQAITFLAHLRERPPTTNGKARPPHLVVMPTSLIFNWKNEFTRFCPSITVAEYVGAQRNWAKACEHEVILTTYDTLRIDKNRIADTPFDVVILDEAQAAKNLTSARFKALTHLKARFTLVLTGTPMENHVGEYFAIMQLAVPGLFGSYRDFTAKMKRGHESILKRARPFILRRTKAKILKELPPKQETEIYLEMTDLQKEVYTRMVAEVKAEVLSAFEETVTQRAGIAALAALLRLRQVCIEPNLIGAGGGVIAPKFDYVLQTLRELNDEGHSVLVFSSFAKALDLLGKAAVASDLPVLHLNGKTPPNQRRIAVQTFQASETPLNFFISLKAGGSGLNLTKASYVIHLDPWWNPAAENQASDRAHRIGQTARVTIQRLIMRHTVEEKIMVLKERKQKLFTELIDGSGSRSSRTGSVLTREDVDYLLSDSE